jgi:hypothetical protein
MADSSRKHDFDIAITSIKRHARQDRDRMAMPRPPALINLTHDADMSCYRWAGLATVEGQRPWTKVEMTETEYLRHRVLETQHQLDQTRGACQERNRIIQEIEHLLYTTLDHVPLAMNMGRKLRAIQTILDDDDK